MRLAAWTWLLPSLAFAGGTEISGRGLEPLGWTADGHLFAWVAEGSVYDDLTPDGVTLGYWDVEKDRAGSVAGKAAAEKWKKAHPLAPLATGRTSPDGQAKADVKVLAASGGGWSKGPGEGAAGFTPGGQSGAELRVERGGKSWISVDWGGGVHTVQPFWSPNGRHVAWVVHPKDWEGMDGTTTWQVLFGPAGLPRIHVLAGKALLDQVGPKVKADLDSKGFFTVYLGKALKERDASVVYAAPGLEAEAARAAAAIPGGAKVDKLNWKVNAELVVALGKTAGGAK